jgi:hypothetical protein
MAYELRVLGRSPGRPLHVERDGTFWLGRHFDVLCSEDAGQSWQRVTRIPTSWARHAARPSRLAGRLLRNEVKALARLSDGTLVATNRQGVYRAEKGESVMGLCRIGSDTPSLMPPMTLGVGPADRVLFGEYGSPRGRREIRLYASDDRARSFEVAHVFPSGEILHVHNVIYDRSHDYYWVLAGDHEGEPGIGRLSIDLTSFEWLGKGSQDYRAVEVFDFGDRLVYATDTEVEQNGLIQLDKASGRVERLRDFEGSCLYACRFGSIYALTTTVEPSPVNPCRSAGLWLSRDGDRWEEAFRAEKDRWSARLFQFGSLVLPRGASDRETVLFGGQALEGIDGVALVAKWTGPVD